MPACSCGVPDAARDRIAHRAADGTVQRRAIYSSWRKREKGGDQAEGEDGRQHMRRPTEHPPGVRADGIPMRGSLSQAKPIVGGVPDCCRPSINSAAAGVDLAAFGGYGSAMVEAYELVRGLRPGTTTVHGKCANCWYVKNPAGVPARRRYQAPLWDGSDLTAFVWGWVSWAPGLVALVLGLVLTCPH